MVDAPWSVETVSISRPFWQWTEFPRALFSETEKQFLLLLKVMDPPWITIVHMYLATPYVQLTWVKRVLY